MKEISGKQYTYSHTRIILRKIFKAKFSKPYNRDYRQSPYYKGIFRLKMYHKLNKYQLKYDNENMTITNLETNEPLLIFSYDETSQQFTANNVRVWSLTKPRMIKNTTKVKNSAVGAYSLTTNGVDIINFIENSKAETLATTLDLLRKNNPTGDIILMLDNFPSHKAYIFKKKAKELNIDLLSLPAYSPELQPVEKVWHTGKRDISAYKIANAKNVKKISVEETERILKEEMTKSFHNTVPSKNKWKTILEDYIKPIIKKLNPTNNLNWEVQNIC